MNYFLVILAPFLTFFLSKFLVNKSLLLNFSGDKHQNYTLEKKFH